jgi:hypothetical protein
LISKAVARWLILTVAFIVTLNIRKSGSQHCSIGVYRSRYRDRVNNHVRENRWSSRWNRSGRGDHDGVPVVINGGKRIRIPWAESMVICGIDIDIIGEHVTHACSCVHSG